MTSTPENRPHHLCVNNHPPRREQAIETHGENARTLPAHITRTQLITAIQALGLDPNAVISVNLTSQQATIAILRQTPNARKIPAMIGSGSAITQITYDIYPGPPPCETNKDTQ